MKAIPFAHGRSEPAILPLLIALTFFQFSGLLPALRAASLAEAPRPSQSLRALSAICSSLRSAVSADGPAGFLRALHGSLGVFASAFAGELREFSLQGPRPQAAGPAFSSASPLPAVAILHRFSGAWRDLRPSPARIGGGTSKGPAAELKFFQLGQARALSAQQSRMGYDLHGPQQGKGFPSLARDPDPEAANIIRSNKKIG